MEKFSNKTIWFVERTINIKNLSMKILFINPYYYPNNIGGTESVVKLLAEQLVLYGNTVAIYTIDSPINHGIIEEISGVKVYRGTGGDFISRSRKVITKITERIKNACIQRFNLSVLKELDNVLMDFQPDIVNTQNLYGFSPLIWKRIKSHNIPIIHTINDYWITRHSVKPFVNLSSKLVDYYITPSSFMMDIIKKSNIFNCHGMAISNGIKINRSYFAQCIKEKKNKGGNESIKFLFVGQLEKIKGVDRLIKVFQTKRSKNIELHICGKGSLAEHVIQATKKDDRIFYHGFVLAQDLEKIYRNSDVLVIPSTWEEPFGMVAIEAYYRGLTVIAGNRGGLKEIVSNIGVGKLIDPLNSKELASTITYYSKISNIKKDVMSLNDKIFEYTINKQATAYQSIFQKYSNDWKV